MNATKAELIETDFIVNDQDTVTELRGMRRQVEHPDDPNVGFSHHR